MLIGYARVSKNDGSQTLDLQQDTLIFNIKTQESNLTMKQEKYFRKACGVARFTWNWALVEWQRQYQSNQKPNGLKLKKEFNSLKTLEFPWRYEVTKYASQQPFIYLQSAFQRFFRKESKYPRFKKKGIHDSFYVGNDQIKTIGKEIKIPKFGWIRLKVLTGHGAQIDTTTANGRLIFGNFASLAEFERELIIERTRTGLAAVRARGRNGGRPRKMDKHTLKMAMAAMTDPKSIVLEVVKR